MLPLLNNKENKQIINKKKTDGKNKTFRFFKFSITKVIIFIEFFYRSAIFHDLPLKQKLKELFHSLLRVFFFFLTITINMNLCKFSPNGREIFK